MKNVTNNTINQKKKKEKGKNPETRNGASFRFHRTVASSSSSKAINGASKIGTSTASSPAEGNECGAGEGEEGPGRGGVLSFVNAERFAVGLWHRCNGSGEDASYPTSSRGDEPATEETKERRGSDAVIEE
ncbi:hypothetical protein ACOSQ2_005494 [Xanthoceras sorbifolium]